MFYNYGPKEKPLNVTITQTTTEHRAPTDDSIRIIQEMRDKIIRGILDTGSEELNSNLLRWSVHPGEGFRGVEIRFALTFNGKPVEGLVLLNDIAYKSKDPAKCREYVREQFFNAIRNALIYTAFNDVISQAASMIAAVLEKNKSV